MARPAKPIELASGARTKEEIESRAAAEKKLKSKGNVTAPKTLTKSQKAIFRKIVNLLKEANTLCTLDVWILAKTAIAIDMLQQIDCMVEQDHEKLFNREVMNTRRNYTQDFFRGCNELGLSPQARAKLAISITAKEETDPLIDALADDEL